MWSSTLHAEIIASFNSPLFDSNHSLLEEVPSNQAQHNIYPLFTPSELPSPSSTVTETENSQLFATPPLTPTQNSQLQTPILSYPFHNLYQQQLLWLHHTPCPCAMSADAIVMLLPAEIAEITPIHKDYKIDWTSYDLQHNLYMLLFSYPTVYIQIHGPMWLSGLFRLLVIPLWFWQSEFLGDENKIKKVLRMWTG